MIHPARLFPESCARGLFLQADEAGRLSMRATNYIVIAADLIVLGSHGLGPVNRRLLGSVSPAVALHALCSVEIVRCGRGTTHASGQAG
jgi:hypothetical protein